MTPIKDMQPGRELDALVAEKVMGWDVEIFRKQNGWWVRDREIDAYKPFRPSTDISAAWEAQEKAISMDEMKYLKALDMAVNPNANSQYWNPEDVLALIRATPEQRCKAALMAVGGE